MYLKKNLQTKKQNQPQAVNPGPLLNPGQDLVDQSGISGSTAVGSTSFAQASAG